MKKTYWSRGLFPLSLLLSCVAFIFAIIALRKYGADITQIPSKLRVSLITANFLNVIVILICGIYALFHTAGKSKGVKCSLLIVLFAIVNISISGAVLLGDYPYIKSIDLRYLDEVSKGISGPEYLPDYDGIYYIGRQDCSPCQTFYRTLQTLTEKYCAHIFYYDTFEDRQTNMNNMYGVLSQLSVNTVPLVFIVQNGAITNVFSGDSIEIDLRNYLAEN